MVITIQSISDIITNSSTEVYTIYTKNDIKTIKSIVNALLALFRKDKKSVSDVFANTKVVFIEEE